MAVAALGLVWAVTSVQLVVEAAAEVGVLQVAPVVERQVAAPQVVLLLLVEATPLVEAQSGQVEAAPLVGLELRLVLLGLVWAVGSFHRPHPDTV